MKRVAATRALLSAFAAAVLLACFGGAAEPGASPPIVSDEEAMRFALRAERFYHSLQGIPLPATVTFYNRELHQYFPTPSAFADYYSSLAMLARQNTLRDGQARSVRIREFHFEGPEQAVVDVVITGKHERELRFWDIDLDRRDIWRRVDGVWVIVPEKL